MSTTNRKQNGVQYTRGAHHNHEAAKWRDRQGFTFAHGGDGNEPHWFIVIPRESNLFALIVTVIEFLQVLDNGRVGH